MNLAFIDLETTNADEQTGSILEIGLTVTNEELHVLDRWETVVEPTSDQHLVDMPEVVREMHTASGLLDEIYAASGTGSLPTVVEADIELAEHLAAWKSRGQVVLAGSGVGHFDARWIRQHLPYSDRLLTFWTIDVGVVRRFLSMLVGAEIPDTNDRKPHRGQADVRLHLDEAIRYRDAMRACVEILNREMARPRPGDRIDDGGEPGTLVRCENCSGDGLLHRPDQLPPIATPQEG